MADIGNLWFLLQILYQVRAHTSHPWEKETSSTSEKDLQLHHLQPWWISANSMD